MHGFTSVFFGYHGYQWLSVVFYGYQRLCMVTSGFYGYHGYQWFSMVTTGFYGYLRLCMGLPLVFMVTGDRAWLSKIVDVVGVFMVISGKKFPTYNKGMQRSS